MNIEVKICLGFIVFASLVVIFSQGSVDTLSTVELEQLYNVNESLGERLVPCENGSYDVYVMEEYQPNYSVQVICGVIVS